MVSKQRVAHAKAGYFTEKTKTRTIVPLDYEKRIKQQNKMFKLQTGKIQKLTQRESTADPLRMT